MQPHRAPPLPRAPPPRHPAPKTNRHTLRLRGSPNNDTHSQTQRVSSRGNEDEDCDDTPEARSCRLDSTPTPTVSHSHSSPRSFALASGFFARRTRRKARSGRRSAASVRAGQTGEAKARTRCETRWPPAPSTTTSNPRAFFSCPALYPRDAPSEDSGRTAALRR